jgi:hypothetical protein
VSVSYSNVVRVNAHIRSAQENVGAEAQALRENMPKLWSKKRGYRGQMQEMPHQEPALEETRNREVILIF